MSWTPEGVTVRRRPAVVAVWHERKAHALTDQAAFPGRRSASASTVSEPKRAASAWKGSIREPNRRNGISDRGSIAGAALERVWEGDSRTAVGSYGRLGKMPQGSEKIESAPGTPWPHRPSKVPRCVIERPVAMGPLHPLQPNVSGRAPSPISPTVGGMEPKCGASRCNCSIREPKRISARASIAGSRPGEI